MSAEFVAVTTWSRRKRHWAAVEALEPYELGPGWKGQSLCPMGGGATDQEATRSEARYFKMDGRWLSVVVADLPVCKVCDRMRRRHEAALPAVTS